MKRIRPCLLILAGLSLGLFLVFVLAPPAQALPEYAAQTGEPCASCHISPSGGGARTPRGQAWVGSGKPSTVPDLVAALEALGVHLEVDPSLYTTPPETIAPPQPLQAQPAPARELNRWLQGYPGN